MPSHPALDPLYAAFAEYASKHWDREEWSQFGRDTGTSDILNAHPRLYKSLGFGDPDYPEAVWSVVPRVVREAAASEGLSEQMDLIASFVPDLIGWVQGSDSSPRTRRRFAAFLQEHSNDIPEEWLAPRLSPDTAPRPKRAQIAAAVPPVVSAKVVATKAEHHDPRRSASEPTAAPSIPENPSIFLVHGRDIPAVHEIQVFVQRVTGVMPESLADEPGRGDTIIEKFERRANRVTFAIVLLTPDDVGRAATDDDLRPRARQNVILELGYFIAKLGRQWVAVLNADVETPSDIDGVNYIAFPEGNWKWSLQQELQAAGFSK